MTARKFKFSNFQMVDITIAGVSWPSVEHYYQAMKSADPAEQSRIRKLPKPYQAKTKGRKLTMRPDWEEVKEEMMMTALRVKFTHPDCRQSLLSTGDEEIVEWNHWHDNYWGCCECQKCKNKEGMNRLGHLLMQLRAELSSR